MKKSEQLGMNPSTASNRLVKDLLFMFVEKSGYKCFRCKKDMSRGDFSIEHIKPWIDSENPKEFYFDLKNISFSHLACNIKASRNGVKNKYTCDTERQDVNKFNKRKFANKVCPTTGLTNRQLQYKRTGK